MRSGLTSNEYFDKYRFESQPKLLRAIAKRMTPLIPAGTEILAGLEMGGIPIATALSLETGLPVAFVRKEAKSYGTVKLAEGIDINNKQLLVVEDVITTGGQVIVSSGQLINLGAKIAHVICAIDREQGGREKLAEHNLQLISLFKMVELKNSKPS